MMSYIHTLQFKGNLTHADRAHATYWPRAHSYINPYWGVWEVKTCLYYYLKGKDAG